MSSSKGMLCYNVIMLYIVSTLTKKRHCVGGFLADSLIIHCFVSDTAVFDLTQPSFPSSQQQLTFTRADPCHSSMRQAVIVSPIWGGSRAGVHREHTDRSIKGSSVLGLYLWAVFRGRSCLHDRSVPAEGTHCGIKIMCVYWNGPGKMLSVLPLGGAVSWTAGSDSLLWLEQNLAVKEWISKNHSMWPTGTIKYNPDRFMCFFRVQSSKCIALLSYIYLYIAA